MGGSKRQLVGTGNRHPVPTEHSVPLAWWLDTQQPQQSIRQYAGKRLDTVVSLSGKEQGQVRLPVWKIWKVAGVGAIEIQLQQAGGGSAWPGDPL